MFAIFWKGLFPPHDGVLTFINISLDLKISSAKQLPNRGRNQLYVFPLCFVMKHVYVYIKVLLLCVKPMDVLKLHNVTCSLLLWHCDTELERNRRGQQCIPSFSVGVWAFSFGFKVISSFMLTHLQGISHHLQYKISSSNNLHQESLTWFQPFFFLFLPPYSSKLSNLLSIDSIDPTSHVFSSYLLCYRPTGQCFLGLVSFPTSPHVSITVFVIKQFCCTKRPISERYVTWKTEDLRCVFIS